MFIVCPQNTQETIRQNGGQEKLFKVICEGPPWFIILICSLLNWQKCPLLQIKQRPSQQKINAELQLNNSNPHKINKIFFSFTRNSTCQKSNWLYFLCYIYPKHFTHFRNAEHRSVWSLVSDIIQRVCSRLLLTGRCVFDKSFSPDGKELTLPSN